MVKSFADDRLLYINSTGYGGENHREHFKCIEVSCGTSILMKLKLLSSGVETCVTFHFKWLFLLSSFSILSKYPSRQLIPWKATGTFISTFDLFHRMSNTNTKGILGYGKLRPGNMLNILNYILLCLNEIRTYASWRFLDGYPSK